MRTFERAAGGGVARAIVAQQRAIAILHFDRRQVGHHAFEDAFDRDARRREMRRSDRSRGRQHAGKPADGVGACGRDRDGEFRGFVLDRIEPMCRPVCGFSSRRLRERSARSSALTRVPCSASIASTSRSRKRRRSEAEPVNRPSIAGTSQSTRR